MILAHLAPTISTFEPLPLNTQVHLLLTSSSKYNSFIRVNKPSLVQTAFNKASKVTVLGARLDLHGSKV